MCTAQALVFPVVISALNLINLFLAEILCIWLIYNFQMASNVDPDLERLTDRKFTILNVNLTIRRKLSVIKSDLSFEFVVQPPATACPHVSPF